MESLALLVTIILLSALVLGAVTGGIVAYSTRGMPFWLRLVLLASPLILMTFTTIKTIVLWAMFGVAFGAAIFWGYGRNSK